MQRLLVFSGRVQNCARLREILSRTEAAWPKPGEGGGTMSGVWDWWSARS